MSGTEKRGAGISISMTGGGQIGAVNQGDNATITTHVAASGQGNVAPEDVQALRAELERVAEDSAVTFAEMRKVEAVLAEMEAEAASGTGGSMERIGTLARSIHDNFGWAAVPLSVFLKGFF